MRLATSLTILILAGMLCLGLVSAESSINWVRPTVTNYNSYTINNVSVSDFLNKTGDTMSGNLDMGGYDIVNVGTLSATYLTGFLSWSYLTDVPLILNGTNGLDGANGINGTNGVDGADGYTPIKGVDYFDGLNGSNGLNGTDGINGSDGYTPIKGIDYFDGLNGTDGINGTDGYTPIKGVDYFDGLNGTNGLNGTDGLNGANGTTYTAVGPYLINDSTAIYFNESLLNSTILSLTGIHEEWTQLSVIGGTGTNTTTTCCSQYGEILHLLVVPTTPTNKYRFSAYTTIGNEAIDTDRQLHTGNWSVAHRGSVVMNDTITYSITNAQIDEAFNVRVRWRAG